MRAFSALMVVLCLCVRCEAEDWTAIHDAALGAIKSRDYVSAVTLLERSWEAAGTPGHRAVSANDLGIVLHQSGHEAEARIWLERATQLWRDVSEGASHTASNLASSSVSLSLVDRMLGDYVDAESVLKTAIQYPNLTVASRMKLIASLGDIFREEGRFAEARPLLIEAENTPGASLRQRLDSAIAMAQLDRDTHNLDASIDEWTRTGALARDNSEPAAEATCVRGLGQTWLERGNAARAEPLLRKALEMFSRLPLRDETEMGTILFSLGQLYLSQDKTALAEESLNRALAVEEQGFGPAHPQVALVLQSLADAVARGNRLELARLYLDRAQTIMSARFGERSALSATVLANRAAIEERSGHLDSAADCYRKALEAVSSAGADIESFRNRLMTGYVRVLRSTHHGREADALMAQSHSAQ